MDLLTHVGLSDNKTIYNPFKIDVELSPKKRTILENPTLYRQLVRSLIYLNIIRPNVTYYIHVC